MEAREESGVGRVKKMAGLGAGALLRSVDLKCLKARDVSIEVYWGGKGPQ